MSKIVLFIEGVYTKDICLDKVICDDSETSEDEVVSSYDIIPQKFMGLDVWVLQTNVLCGNCGMPHTNPPVPIPKYFNDSGEKTVVTIMKLLFCSFPCAARYIEENFVSSDRENKHGMLRYMYRIFTGTSIDVIPLSPERSQIDIYGGGDSTYTSSQYQKYVDQLIPISSYCI